MYSNTQQIEQSISYQYIEYKVPGVQPGHNPWTGHAQREFQVRLGPQERKVMVTQALLEVRVTRVRIMMHTFVTGLMSLVCSSLILTTMTSRVGRFGSLEGTAILSLSSMSAYI